MSDYLPAVRRARIERLNIYQVSESELALLERGSAESIYLNFAIFFISSALSFLATLLTTPIASPKTFVVLLVLCAVGLAAGAVLLSLWLWYKRSRATIFADIRRRMPPDGTLVIEGDR